MAKSNPIISVQNLAKSFPNAPSPVLNGVSLTLNEGELTLIMGRSGSGKSTLLHCIAGLEQFDGGEISIVGNAISQCGVEALARLRLDHIGMVFQFFNLIGSMTIEQNILLPAHLSKSSIAEKRGLMLELCEMMSIQHVLHKYPHEISGGEAQRAAIARALLLRPAILLADEPTGNLDAESGDAVLHLFQKIRDLFKVCILLVSHDPGIRSLCDKGYVLNDGGSLDVLG